jgi:metal-sulfur cluster biosynthetic enzyme
MITPATIASLLSHVYDPELGIDMVSLGLVYGIEVDDERLHVRFAVTSPACPMAETIAGMAAARIGPAAEGRNVELELADDPPWEPAMLDGAAREQLGLAVA